MTILGLNAFHGDSSAAVLQDGQLTAAIEEERFNRIKHWAGLPILSAKACLNGKQPGHIAISRDPKTNFAAKLRWTASRPSNWARALSRAKNAIRITKAGDDLRAAGIGTAATKFHFIEHHRAHLASAFFCSPFDEAAIVSIDGFGDFSSVMWGIGRGNQIEVMGAVHFPHSLGQFYTAFTQFLGFPNYGDEYKMMGLSAYGERRFADQIRDVVKTERDQMPPEPRLFHSSQSRCRNVLEFRRTQDRLSLLAQNERSLRRAQTARLGDPPEPQRPRRVRPGRSRGELFCPSQFRSKTNSSKAVCLAGGVALNCVLTA